MLFTSSFNTLQRAFAHTQPRLNGELPATTMTLSDLAVQPLEFSEDGECININVKESIIEILQNRFFSEVETIVTILINAFGYQTQFNEILQDVQTERGEPVIFDDLVRRELASDGITLVQDDAGLVTMHKFVTRRQQEISNSISDSLPIEGVLALIRSYDTHSIEDEFPIPTAGEFIEESMAYLDQLTMTSEDPDQVILIKSLLNELGVDPAKTDNLSFEERQLLDKARSVFI